MSRFIEIPQNPVPAGAEISSFTARDGAALRIAFYPADNAIGTVVVMTGWAEYLEKYFEVADDLRARRLNVAMMDWRGQGLSARATSWSGYFYQLADDLKTFRDAPVATRFDGPYYLLTHSMGGMAALMLLAQGYQGFERAALCAPMTRMFEGPSNEVYNAVAITACLLGAGNQGAVRGHDDSKLFDGNMYTKDRRRHDRFRLLQAADPDAALAAPTYGWIRDCIASSKRIHRDGFFDQLKTPVRLISAGDERRIDGSDHRVIAAANPLIEQVTIDGALHEIMMETDELRAAFWACVDEFFSATAP